MRAVFACLILASTLIAAVPARAASDTELSGILNRDVAGERRQSNEQLDELFLKLKREPSDRGAQRIAGQIWQQWLVSGSGSIDLMMSWAKDAMDKEKYDVALDFLDQIVSLAPDYAEGWNRRATLHFMRDDYAKSLSDIEQTLALEPRHFGALSGLGAIMQNIGNDKMALAAYEQVLDVYPMNREAQKAVVELTDKLAGQGI